MIRTTSKEADLSQLPSPALSFFDHLEELQARLLVVAITFVLCLFGFYPFADNVLALLAQPVGKLYFTAPADAFLANITLTIWGALFLSLPVIVYQSWRFAASGLKETEKKFIFFFMPLSLGCFLVGGVFAYFTVVPISLRFFLSFSSSTVTPMISVKEYVSYVGTTILACGVTFQLPLVLMFLTKIGIATPAFLIQKRRHAIILILIVSAIVTPPDVITQIIMAVPLLILYELGIIFSRMGYAEK
jgi:sec-independent protein translocase protein TatC